ncbi:hypothetical protein [Calderihabitans maritimus]|uniref:Uncharacterized protein n=1 Tax=Calderihabitans maritimus TaxID=1246530 RepID=A0A1Z5HW45_9FIRM|nr:hypothetical protein [Calderihabitans maritimus]GAW93490.1 hypothetical protein MTY_0265 [Calderihabitans maritimus]
MKATLDMMSFQEPRRKKCDCCDRTGLIRHKLLVAKAGLLVGDLEFCQDCARVMAEIMAAREVKEEVVEEWDFAGGGAGHGESVDPGR